jgi:hypothetical protein
MAGKRKISTQDLLTALACGANVAQAAAKVGLSQRSIYRRLADPSFRQEVEDLRMETVRRSSAMLTAATVEAIKTVIGLLSSKSDQARLGACRTIFEYGVKLREFTELQERLAELEARLEAMGDFKGARHSLRTMPRARAA